MDQSQTAKLENHSIINQPRTKSGAGSSLEQPEIKPLPLIKTIIYGLIPALALYLTHYYLIPVYVERTGISYFEGYLVGYVLSMAFFFAAAFIAFRREGNPFTWGELKTRFRLAKMDPGDWGWVLGLIILSLLAYFGLAFTGDWVRSVAFLAPRQAWPAEFGPGGTSQLIPGEFMGFHLIGQWWIIPVYFLGWFFNIFGEEFWFRGYLLPRQEVAFGRVAWLVNGLMFTCNHLWQPWIMIAILPVSLLLAYIVQTRRNTWIGIIQHGFMNIGLLFYLIAGVLGIA